MNASFVVSDHLPRAHLDASLSAVLSRALQLRALGPHPDLEQSLRRSLGMFVRAELCWAAALPDDLELVPDRLHRHVTAAVDLGVHNLQPYARRLASQWCASLLELLERLDGDWSDIVRRLGISADVMLAVISSPLGDLHHRGRSVFKLQFSDGMGLIYKPRSVQTEHIFGGLLAWLRDNGCQPDFSSCHALPKDGYGWTLFIPTEYCRTSDQATAYYHRQGGLLALFWLLCGGDAIADNVVVSRDHPVWVDTECLSRPDLSALFPNTSSFPDWIKESMLTTAMVLYGGGRESALREQTGLAVSCAENRSDVFTDENVLREPYLRAVIRGFKDVYQWMLAHDKARSLDDGPLGFCRGCNVRVLLRSTQTYAVIVRLLAITPASRMKGVWADVRELLRVGDRPGLGPFPEQVIRAELRALARGDIPYWSTSTSSHDLWEAGGGLAKRIATLTCMECIARRVSRMNETDLSRQAWLLESFLRGSNHRGRPS